MESKDQNPRQTIHLVSSTDSVVFIRWCWAVAHSSVIGLDAEWKPVRTHQSTFPTVSLLQIACRVADHSDADSNSSNTSHCRSDELLVFLLDLLAIPLPSVYEILRDVFVSPKILKLGFRFKQDLAYLSSTFCAQGCDPGFDRVEPFLDISHIYNTLQHKQLSGRRIPKQSKSLATICQEVLGISLSKELQCSDWSQRPLSEEQKTYAAADAQCLLEIFDVFKERIEKEGDLSHKATRHRSSALNLGLKQILETPVCSKTVFSNTVCDASELVRAAMPELFGRIPATEAIKAGNSIEVTKMDSTLSWIIRKYSDKILLKDSDREPKFARKQVKKVRKSSAGMTHKERQLESIDDWQGPPPWDLSLGGDGRPKFLCDVMVEGLAKHLRCVGIDAAVPHSKKPDSRDLIDQAYREKRVLLTRDAKLLRHNYAIKNQIYRVKTLLKNEQLLEVIEMFQLKISEDQLMSRCTKCNGEFIKKPLTTEEAVDAAKGFQVIPNCLFNQNLEFWQCMDCCQLYWEGTQYHSAVQKFINVCKLNE